MLPDDHRHGTEAGYEQHRRDLEPACPPCVDADLRAARSRGKRRTMGHRFTVPVGEARIVLQAWRDGGASLDDIALHVGVVDSQVHRILNGDRSTTIYARTAAAITAAARRGSPVTTDGAVRRIRALTWLGYPVRAIAAEAGVDHDTVLDARNGHRVYMTRNTRLAIVAAYDRLHMTTPTTGKTQQHRAGITRARNTAVREGWLPPLAWADIDLGHVADDRSGRVDVDPVVVDRILAGDTELAANPAERAEVVTRWRAGGRSLNDLERATGWNVARLVRALPKEDAA